MGYGSAIATGEKFGCLPLLQQLLNSTGGNVSRGQANNFGALPRLGRGLRGTWGLTKQGCY